MGPGLPGLVLRAANPEESIKHATTLVFESHGWTTEAAAAEAGTTYLPALVVALARLRVGADFGTLPRQPVMTDAGRAMMQAKLGRRVLDGHLGLTVYESNPTPIFIGSSLKVAMLVPQRHLEQILGSALKDPPVLTDRERLALELFNASFFQPSADSRFLMLVMAIEALLDWRPRSSAAAKHVDSMIAATGESATLTSKEKSSLIGSLKPLKCESIGSAGRRLVGKHLAGREYMGKRPEAFFSHCYGLRSRLVHGEHPVSAVNEVGAAVGTLEVCVSDLLSGRLAEVELS